MAAPGGRPTDVDPQSRLTPESPGLDGLVSLLSPLEHTVRVILAVSGGPDSTALMHLAALWRRRNAGPDMVVATVDHGLRPEARQEADQVMVAADRLGFDAVRLTWTGDKPKRGLPARARAARYDLLLAHARSSGASQIVTAHTLDDQAETVLMRLSRGSGPLGLAGMRDSVDLGGVMLERPLLRVRKAELVALCDASGWAYAEDPFNDDRAYARTRWRQLAPILAREGLTADTVGRFARRLSRVDLALQRWAVELGEKARLPGNGRSQRFCMDQLASVPEEMLLRILGASLAGVSGRDQPRLGGLEALGAELIRAFRDGRECRRTFHHCVVALDRDGVVDLAPEPPRRRGRKPALQHETRSAAANDAAPPPSLGKATPPSYIGRVAAPPHVIDGDETHGASAVSAREPMLSTGPQ